MAYIGKLGKITFGTTKYSGQLSVPLWVMESPADSASYASAQAAAANLGPKVLPNANKGNLMPTPKTVKEVEAALQAITQAAAIGGISMQEGLIAIENMQSSDALSPAKASQSIGQVMGAMGSCSVSMTQDLKRHEGLLISGNRSYKVLHHSKKETVEGNAAVTRVVCRMKTSTLGEYPPVSQFFQKTVTFIGVATNGLPCEYEGKIEWVDAESESCLLVQREPSLDALASMASQAGMSDVTSNALKEQHAKVQAGFLAILPGGFGAKLTPAKAPTKPAKARTYDRPKRRITLTEKGSGGGSGCTK